MNQFLKLLNESNLSKKEQAEFARLIDSANEDQRASIISTVKTHPELIGVLWDIFKAKQKAFTQKDMNAWERIIKKEIDALIALQQINTLH